MPQDINFRYNYMVFDIFFIKAITELIKKRKKKVPKKYLLFVQFETKKRVFREYTAHT